MSGDPVGMVKGGLDALLQFNPLNLAIDLGCDALHLPKEVKDAAKVAGGICTLNPIMMWDGILGLGQDFAQMQARSAQTECCYPRTPEGCGGYATRPPSGTPGSGGSGSTGGSSGSGGAGGSSPLDPNLRAYRSAVEVLQANLPTFDTASGTRDGLFTRDDLRAITGNPNASGTLRNAAQFMLDHNEFYNRLEMAAGIAGKDGIIGAPDLSAELCRIDQELATYGSPRSTSSASTGVPASPSPMRSILDDPGLSIEEKIQAVLSQVTNNLDDEINGVMGEIADQSDRAMAIRNDDPDAAAQRQKSQTSSEQLNLRLQKLMERRNAMFQLQSNMSEKFNEMAKTALSNLARA